MTNETSQLSQKNEAQFGEFLSSVNETQGHHLVIVPFQLRDRAQQKIEELAMAGCINFKPESFLARIKGELKFEGRPAVVADFEPTNDDYQEKGHDYNWAKDNDHLRGTEFIARTGNFAQYVTRQTLESIEFDNRWGNKRPKISSEKLSAMQQKMYRSQSVQEKIELLKEIYQTKRVKGLLVIVRGLSNLAPHIREEVLKEMNEMKDAVTFVMLDYQPVKTSFEHGTSTRGLVAGTDYQIDDFKIESD